MGAESANSELVEKTGRPRDGHGVGTSPFQHTALVLIVLLFPHVSPAQTVREWAEAYTHPTLGGAGTDVSGKTFQLAHLEIDVASGHVYPVLAGSLVVGAFFDGDARFRYRVDDPRAADVWRHNVEKASSYELGAKGEIDEALQDCLVMLSTGAQAFGAGSEWLDGEAPATVSRAFRDHLQRWSNDRALRYVHLMPQARVEASIAPIFTVELGAQKHDLHLVYDPIRTGDESLAVMRKSKSNVPGIKGTRFPLDLVTQPIGRQRLDARPFRFELVELAVEVVNPRDRDAEVRVRETLRAAVPVQVLAFWLKTIFIDTNETTASFNLESVTDGDGDELVWQHAGDFLLVQLSQPLDAGATVELEFVLSGGVLYRPGNDSYWQLDGAWYPKPTLWAQEAFTYDAVVKAASGFTPFSNGRTVRRWEENNLTCAEFKEDFPMQHATVLAGKYNTYTDARDELTVRVSTYAFKNESAAKTVASLVHGCVKYYEPLLGAYPYPELDVVEINDVGGARAPAGLIYVPREAFNPTSDHLTQAYVVGINRRIAHEVAHGWWGHTGTLADLEDQWLSESTADYYAAIAMGALIHEREFKRSMREWKNGAKQVRDVSSVYLANFVSGDGANTHRRNLLYNKGPLVLHALRQEVGDQVFFTILKSLLSSFHGQPLRTRDLIQITEFITEQDWDDWFERYLFGLETPNVD